MASAESLELPAYPTNHHGLPSARELVLTAVETERLCDHAIKGEFQSVDQWVQLCERSFGMDHVVERSLYPADQPSPFVLAALACQEKFLRHLLKRYSKAIPIDRTSKVSLPPIECICCTRPRDVPQEAKTEHYCSAVFAACAAYDLAKPRRHNVVKLLVEAGASVNTPECCGVTPLHAVLIYGNRCDPKLVKFLVDHGADINATDCMGRTPLMLATVEKFGNVVAQLIRSGAKLNAVDKEGWSALHYASSWGCRETVQCLVASGADPMFQPAHGAIIAGEIGTTGSYVPCPLYLNAKFGIVFQQQSQILLDHPTCPDVCRVEALLLMGASGGVWNRTTGSCSNIKDPWNQALSLIEEHNISLDYPPPIADYGNRKEIRKASGLHALTSGPSPLDLDEAVFQSLMIFERCLGYANKTVVESMFRAGEFFLKKAIRDGENLLLRAVEMVVHITNTFGYGTRATFFKQGHTHVLTYYINDFKKWILYMSEHKHRPYYPRYLKLTLRIVEMHGNTYGLNTHTEISRIFRSVAFIVNSWLLDNECVDENGFHIGSDECEETGRKLVELVSRYGSIIGFLLCEVCNLSKPRRRRTIPLPDYLPVFSAFLRWGASTQINELLLCCGQRQLHMAVLHARDYEQHRRMVALFLQFGAHYDAVNAAGQTAQELCLSIEEEQALFPPPSPLPLTCCACRYIVKECIPYKDMVLPSHVKQLIALHDPGVFS